MQQSTIDGRVSRFCTTKSDVRRTFSAAPLARQHPAADRRQAASEVVQEMRRHRARVQSDARPRRYSAGQLGPSLALLQREPRTGLADQFWGYNARYLSTSPAEAGESAKSRKTLENQCPRSRSALFCCISPRSSKIPANSPTHRSKTCDKRTLVSRLASTSTG